MRLPRFSKILSHNIFMALAIMAFAMPIASQDASEPIADSNLSIDALSLPKIIFETDNYYLTRAFYPDYAAGDYDSRREILILQERSAPLIAVWDSLGGAVLSAISSLSGIPWHEQSIKIHLMKYMPVAGLYEPLAMPVEGIKSGGRIEAAPSGWFQFLQLVQYLSGRNLLQTRSSDSGFSTVTDHPLLEPGTYRFDVMALTLAIACAKEVVPSDTLADIFNSDRWKRYNPGWEIYKEYLKSKWPLSAEMPLLSYIKSEPRNSPLVEMTSPPKPTEGDNSRVLKKGKALPSVGKGRLGFSVVRGRGGYLDVVFIDSQRLAYACGLRGGDRIQRVNGELAKNERELMAEILDKLDADGAYLLISRDNQTKGILLQPLPAQGN